MLQARPRKLTIDEFIEAYAGVGEKYELIDGEAWLMAGASPTQNLVAGNIFAALRNRLRGTSCIPFGSDLRLRLDAANIRFPDVAVYCDPRDLDDRRALKSFSYPKIVFEVLSPSTQRHDRLHKVLEYELIESLTTIVLVDAERRSLHVFERLNASEWHTVTLAPDAPLVLRDPAVTLTRAEIFEDV